MKKFARKKKERPEVSTASLPDIIFMLLFFFMTVTVLRTASAKVKVELPVTEEAAKINHEASEFNIYIGEESMAGNPMFQINEYLLTREQLDKTLEKIAAPLLDFEKMKVPIYLRVDAGTSMKVVYEVKLMLRKHGLRKINYIVKKAKVV